MEPCPSMLLAGEESGRADRHDGEGVGQVGRVLDEVLAFVQRLKHQLELAVVQVEDRLLQVAHSTVHQLGAFAGRLRPKVFSLYQSRPQAPAFAQLSEFWFCTYWVIPGLYPLTDVKFQ